MPTEHGWGIAGHHGLYVGWWQTRAEAISGHLAGYRGGMAARTRGLSAEERKQWLRRRSRGDRAVKITMKYAALKNGYSR